MGQIAKYRTFAGEEGRFIVAALNIDPDLETILHDLGFETKVIDSNEAHELLEKEKNNPALYQRISGLKPGPSQKMYAEKHPPQYSPEEKEIVIWFLESAKEILKSNQDMLFGFEVAEEIHIEENNDRYRLLVSSKEYPKDRFVIYVRARRPEDIHLMFVPDFSPKTGSTPKKMQFCYFIVAKEKDIQNYFGLKSYPSKKRKPKEDRLEITHQGWKGFSRVVVRELERWNHPDFVEMIARLFLDFMEFTLPLVEEFYQTYYSAKA